MFRDLRTAGPGRLAAARKALIATVAAMAAALSLDVQAVDVDAGDYTALPAGTNLFIMYYQHAERDKLYANGSRVPINAKLDSDIGILRMVHFMDIGGYIVDPQFLMPFGQLKAGGDLSGLGKESGVADLILAATVWVVNKPKEGTYLGITPFVWAPVGNYDRNDPLSLGENRWKFALQVGYITPIAPRWTVDLVADFQLFGKNDDFGPAGGTLKQKVQFQGQGWLRYKVNDALSLYGGLLHVNGGETEINGVDQNNKLSTTYWRAGLQYFVEPTIQIIAGVGSDIDVDQGFKEKWRINLRFLKVF